MRYMKALSFIFIIISFFVFNPIGVGSVPSQKTILEHNVLFLFEPNKQYKRITDAISSEINKLGYRVKSLKNKKYSEENLRDFVGYGSGFFISETGLFLTNYHVIENAKQIVLQLQDGKAMCAMVLACDPLRDIAVLAPTQETRVKSWLSFSNFENPTVGRRIRVLGYPLPKLFKGAKFSTGVISRNTGFHSDTTRMEISAPIQPGSSGSPILNENNEVIGIVCEQLSWDGVLCKTEPLVDGCGFGIKIDTVKSILERVEKKEKTKNHKKRVSFSEAMDATAMVLINSGNLRGNTFCPDQGKCVMIEISKVISPGVLWQTPSYDIISYSIIELYEDGVDMNAAQLLKIGNIAVSSLSTPQEVAKVTVNEILGNMGPI